MAEAAGVAAAAIAFLQAIKAAYNTIESITDLPKQFDKFKNDLPLVEKILIGARKRLEHDKSGLSKEHQSPILSTLEGCRARHQTLRDIFSHLETEYKKLPGPKSWNSEPRSWYLWILKAKSAPKVERLVDEILNDVQKLVNYHIFEGLATKEDIQKLAQSRTDLSGMNPTVEDSELARNGINASLMGDHNQQNNATGDHHTFNNNEATEGGKFSGNFNAPLTVNYAADVTSHGRGQPRESSPQNRQLHRDHFMMPFAKDPDFIERRSLFNRIDRLLNSKNTTQGSRVALYGMGGIGKSSLAIEYAHHVASRKGNKARSWIFWVHASRPERLLAGFNKIADDLQIRRNEKDDILALVCNRLKQETDRKWLIILDSVDSADVVQNIGSSAGYGHLSEYLPLNGSVLVTTRSKRIAEMIVDRCDLVIIPPMDPPDAMALFRKKEHHTHSDDRKARPGCSDEDVQRLLKQLDFIPLAICHASCYISRNEIFETAASYSQKLGASNRIETDLLARGGDWTMELRRDPESVSSALLTWHISFDYILKQRRSAANLLALMSFFACQGIAGELLQPDNYNGSKPEDLEFHEDIEWLQNFCLIKVDTDENGRNQFQLHKLVQLSMRRWLEMENSTLMETNFVTSMYRVWRELRNGSERKWETWRLLSPHVELALQRTPKSFQGLYYWLKLWEWTQWVEFKVRELGRLRTRVPITLAGIIVLSMTHIFGLLDITETDSVLVRSLKYLSRGGILIAVVVYTWPRSA